VNISSYSVSYLTTFLNILGYREKMSARFIKNMSHETLANYFRIFTLTKSRLDLNIPDTPAYLRHCRKETKKQTKNNYLIKP